MPVNATAADTIIGITTAGIPTILAAAAIPDALELLPISAGLSGAVVAAMKTHLIGGPPDMKHPGRLHWLSVVISGAAASVFVAPALADVMGWHAVRWQILTHFIVGLLGSSLCDLVLGNGQRLSKAIVAKLMGTPAIEPPKAEPKVETKDK